MKEYVNILNFHLCIAYNTNLQDEEGRVPPTTKSGFMAQRDCGFVRLALLLIGSIQINKE